MQRSEASVTHHLFPVGGVHGDGVATLLLLLRGGCVTAAMSQLLDWGFMLEGIGGRCLGSIRGGGSSGLLLVASQYFQRSGVDGRRSAVDRTWRMVGGYRFAAAAAAGMAGLRVAGCGTATGVSVVASMRENM